MVTWCEVMIYFNLVYCMHTVPTGVVDTKIFSYVPDARIRTPELRFRIPESQYEVHPDPSIVKNSVADLGCLCFFPSLIRIFPSRIRTKEFKYFNP